MTAAVLAVLYASLALSAFSIVGLGGSSRSGGAPPARAPPFPIAVGLLSYGAFCALQSRYRRVGSSVTGTT